MGLLLNGEGALVTQDLENAEVLNDFFDSVFSKDSLYSQECQLPETGEKFRSKEDKLLADKNWLKINAEGGDQWYEL